MVTQLQRLDRKALPTYRMVLWLPSTSLFVAIVDGILVKRDPNVLHAWVPVLGLFIAMLSLAFLMRVTCSNSTWLKIGSVPGSLIGFMIGNVLIYIINGHSFQNLLVQILIYWVFGTVILTVYMAFRKEPVS